MLSCPFLNSQVAKEYLKCPKVSISKDWIQASRLKNMVSSNPYGALIEVGDDGVKEDMD